MSLEELICESLNILLIIGVVCYEKNYDISLGHLVRINFSALVVVN